MNVSAYTRGVALLVFTTVLIVGCDFGRVSTAEAPTFTTPDPATAASAAPTRYDVFVVAGQSNAQGRGNLQQSPSLPPDVAYESTRFGLQPLRRDPVGGANTGSAWPAFVLQYYESTGRGVVLVESAFANAAMHPRAARAGNNWLPGYGTRYASGIDAGQRALTQARDAGMNAAFGGWLWIQGESDAVAIHQGTLTAQEFGLALDLMLDTYTQDIGAWLGDPTPPPVYLARTGRPRDYDIPGFAAVRATQMTVCEAHPTCEVASLSGASFAGPQYYEDWVHWSQTALNIIGPEMARTASRGVAVVR